MIQPCQLKLSLPNPQHHPLYRRKTYPKQHKYPKQFHPKPNQRPPHENQQHARPESQRALPLVFPREEDERPLWAEEQRDADEEEDVAHGQQGAVEEEDQAEDEEEAAAAAEGDADLCEGGGVSIVGLVAQLVLVFWREGDVLCESESQ